MRRAVPALGIILGLVLASVGSIAFFTKWDQAAAKLCDRQWGQAQVNALSHSLQKATDPDKKLTLQVQIKDYRNWISACNGSPAKTETSAPASQSPSPSPTASHSPSAPASTTSASPTATSSPTKPAAAKSKTQKVAAQYTCRPTFYAGEPGSKGSYTYGKPINANTAKEAVAELKRRINCDPVLLINKVVEFKAVKGAANWSLSKQHDEAVKLTKLARQGKFDEWNDLQQKVDRVLDNPKTKTSLTQLKPGTYTSLVMVQHPEDGVPVVAYVDVWRNGDKVLKVTLPDGGVRLLRLICGGQLQVPHGKPIPVHAVPLIHQHIPRGPEGNPTPKKTPPPSHRKVTPVCASGTSRAGQPVNGMPCNTRHSPHKHHKTHNQPVCEKGGVFNPKTLLCSKGDHWKQAGDDHKRDSGKGTKPPVKAKPKPDKKPPKVDTSHTGGRKDKPVTDKPTNKPGSETGVTAPGADKPGKDSGGGSTGSGGSTSNGNSGSDKVPPVEQGSNDKNVSGSGTSDGGNDGHVTAP